MLTGQNATTSSYACPPKSRFFKFTSSNIMNLGNYKTCLLQILIIFYDMTIGSNEEVISYNFLILVTSKPRFFKFTTSNTENLRNYKTFLLQILIIFYDMTIGSNEEVISYNFLILATSKTNVFQVHYLKQRLRTWVTKTFFWRNHVWWLTGNVLLNDAWVFSKWNKKNLSEKCLVIPVSSQRLR